MLGGITAFFQNITAFPVAKQLQPGQIYSGVVRSTNGGLLIASGTLQIPLEEGSSLTPGQRVTFQLSVTSAGARLLITPEPTEVAAPALKTGSSALTTVLESLGRLDLAQKIRGAIPRHAPDTPSVLRPLITVLLANEGLGPDLEQLAHILSTVAPRLNPGQGAALAIAQWLGLVPPSNSADWEALLLRARQENRVIGRLAASLRSGEPASGLNAIKDSAANLAQHLLSDSEFLDALKEDGQLEPFKALAHRLHERVAGVDLQNLRGLDQTYQFIEIPVRESQGFQRAQVHTFAEKSGQDGQPGSTVHRTVLDLETTRLGALWVSLQTAGPRCACQFKVQDPAIAALLSEEAGTLESALADAGYAQATVSTSLWDGNREDALIAMLAPYQKLDLEI